LASTTEKVLTRRSRLGDWILPSDLVEPALVVGRPRGIVITGACVSIGKIVSVSGLVN
jgi:hypothetical protein